MSSVLDNEKRAELKARRDAMPLLPWDGVDAYIEHAMTLVRPGGMMAVVLPDGKPFFAQRPGPPRITCPACGRKSAHPKDVETGYCGNCHAFTSDGE